MPPRRGKRREVTWISREPYCRAAPDFGCATKIRGGIFTEHRDLLVTGLAILVQVNVSAGGMPKLPVLFARVTPSGIEGDRQKTAKIHGGPDRAVCLYSEELYAQLQSEGIHVRAGELGENFTTRGLDLSSLASGDRLAV